MGDLLARTCGEEFAVLLPGCDAAGAARTADGLRAGAPPGSTASAGSAVLGAHESLDEALARADAARYAAKRAGHDQTVAAVPQARRGWHDALNGSADPDWGSAAWSALLHHHGMSPSTPQVRAAEPADAAAISAIYAPYVEGSPATFEQTPPDAPQMLQRMTSAPVLPWLVGEQDGAVAGYAYATEHRSRPAYRWTVETAVYVAESQQAQGWGRRLYDALIPALANLGYATALAGITLPNPASVALHQAVGFQPSGVFRGVGFKRGAWLDVAWWQLPLRPWDWEPEEPRAWQAP